MTHSTRLPILGFKVITPPTSEQVTLAEARLQLSLDDDGDSPPSHPLDSLIADKIAAAREWCEEYLGRALATQTVELSLGSFTGGAIELPMSPILSVESVKYIDADGDEQTMTEADYSLDNYLEPGWLRPGYGVTWPATYGVANAVKVRYVVGYSYRDDSPETNPLPAKYRAAMILLMTDMVTNRTAAPSPDAERAAESMLELTRVRMSAQ